MVEIIPKETLRLPDWVNALFYVLIFLFIISIVSIFFLNNSLTKSLNNLSSLENSISEKETPENISLEQKIVLYRDKVGDFSYLIGKHLSDSKIFAVVEGFCHPQVYFSDFDFDSKEGKLSLTGETENFKTLGQQELILKKEPLIIDYTLEGVAMNADGKVDFALSINFSPDILK
jgi:hypothetical protein